MFSATAHLYDALYAPMKDYDAEARLVADILRAEAPDVTTVLDVACGTGEHARHLRALGFEVDGVDLDPAMVELAREKNQEGSFEVADMTSLDLARSYDAIVCLFSSIGYVVTTDGLRATLRSFAAHLRLGGVLLVEPWFKPGDMTDKYFMALTGQTDDLVVVRMSHTRLVDRRSLLHFEYLVGTDQGIQRLSELHELGLFTREEMESAFTEAGLQVRHVPEGIKERGLYVGRK
jgi:SAM-dependent methyltransferase